MLAREPEKISLLEIIKAIEGSDFDSFNFVEGNQMSHFLLE